MMMGKLPTTRPTTLHQQGRKANFRALLMAMMPAHRRQSHPTPILRERMAEQATGLQLMLLLGPGRSARRLEMKHLMDHVPVQVVEEAEEIEEVVEDAVFHEVVGL